jgi:hypothetical protein
MLCSISFFELGNTNGDGNDDGNADGDNEALLIRGTHVDNYGDEHRIDETSWISGSSTFAITQYSNQDRRIVAKNGDSNGVNPGLWSRFDWTTTDDGELWYCQTAYDADSEEAAVATQAADPTDPANGGCGVNGFTWTKLSW